MKRRRDIIHRFEDNPIITLEDLDFRCADICNAGAVKFNGQYLLLLSIQSLRGPTSLFLARSTDGYNFTVDGMPFMSPAKVGPNVEHEEQGLLDARIVQMDDDFYICYDVLGRHGFRLSLARTKDFESVEHLGYISQPDAKAGVLFPKKIKGKFARLERPWNGGSIWIGYSDDLTYWGWPEVVMTPRGGYWDPSRIGIATPPMEIEEGWLLIHYGVKETSAGPLFRLGAAILDHDDPVKVVGRTDVPILSPRERYERIGDIPNLVFSCGAIIEPDNQLKLYYGASNSCICMGTADLSEIVSACFKNNKES